MNRRSFLARSGLALGALVVGDEVLEAFERLTHVRKSFPSAGVPSEYRDYIITHVERTVQWDVARARVRVVSARASIHPPRENGTIDIILSSDQSKLLTVGSIVSLGPLENRS